MNEEFENTQDMSEAEISDRGIPSVGNTSNLTPIFIAIILIFAVGAMVLIVLNDMKRSEPASITEPEYVTFRTNSSSSAPYIEIEDFDEPPAEELLAAPSEPPQKTISAFEQRMAEEAFRMAQENKKRKEVRLRSEQLILDDATSGTTQDFNGGSSNLNTSAGSLLSGGNNDPNLAFMNEFSNRSAELVKATQLQNLDALIPQGTLINGILETAIQSDLPGMIRAIVSESIHSFDGSQLLIPKGSKLIGRYRSSLVRGQTRIFVVWSRVLRPDGVSINIDSFGTDSLGRSGLNGELDTHFFERFGSSILLSLIDSSLQIGVNAVDNNNTATVALNSGNDVSNAAEIALENSIGIPPTIYVDQGKRISVFVAKDLDFSNVSN